jgi:hypothetical protein
VRCLPVLDEQGDRSQVGVRRGRRRPAGAGSVRAVMPPAREGPLMDNCQTPLTIFCERALLREGPFGPGESGDQPVAAGSRPERLPHPSSLI